MGEGSEREARAEAPPSPRDPLLCTGTFGEGDQKRLDTDVRKCNNTFSPIKLTKKGLLGVEKGLPPYSVP